MKVYIGIDPGASGYICALAPEVKDIVFFPNTDKPKNIYESLIYLRDRHTVMAVIIEDVHSLFGMSAKSNFNFGRNLGLLYGIIQSAGMGVDVVQPKVWQKEIGVITPKKIIGAPITPPAVRKRKLKEDIAKICERLYPEAEIRGPKGGLLDGKSDALMIAHYASIKYR